MDPYLCLCTVQLATMASVDEERYSQLFFTLDKLTLSHNNLREEIKDSNHRVDSLTSKCIDFHIRMSRAEKVLSLIERENRSKNIVLFKLEDSIKINISLLETILDIFNKVGLVVPETAINDVFRMGKMVGNRPVLIKFVSSRWVRKVFEKIMELKNINYFISNDRSKEDREISTQCSASRNSEVVSSEGE